LLLDLYLGKNVSLEIIPQVKESSPDTKIVILTISDCIEDVLATAEYDIDGYILKNTDFEQFELYLNDIVKGNVRASDSLASLLFTEFLSNAKNKNLTLREREVADLLKQGLSNKEIAANLNLSLYTVKCHVSSIIKKQKLTNRYELLNKS
ncbi:response regulator transcription factor, partial [Selenomonadales bacterium OttesenSCG-928-I06]|nr:response regulator transcription factor [Selenomonadales bacterium OttesenSCG-928-I06]